MKSLILRPVIALVLSLGVCGCQPVRAPQSGGETGADLETLPGERPVPRSYDWSFTTHGGSAELAFGDGDWAEGNSLVTLSCLPNAQSVEVAWAGEGDAVLTSGTATGTFHPGVSTPTDHAVFAAMRSGEPLAVGIDNADMTLESKPVGQARMEAFFLYCTTPPPPPEPEPAAPPSEADDQPNDLPGVQSIEPGVDVVQSDGPAH